MLKFCVMCLAAAAFELFRRRQVEFIRQACVRNAETAGLSAGIFMCAETEKSGSFVVHRKAPSRLLPLGESVRVLVVDDDEVLRKLLAGILNTFGVEVLLAATPEEAEKIYCADKDIEVVLLDIVLSERNGTELFESLKKINPEVRVLFMSGYGQNRRVDEILRQNERTDFIRKPYTADECYAKLAGMLAKK